MFENSVVSKNLEYLEKAGVDAKILKYIKSKPYIITEKLRELIGEDLFPTGQIETLKKRK